MDAMEWRVRPQIAGELPRSRLRRNIVYNFCGQLLIVVLNLLVVRTVFRGLGGDALGIVFASLTLATILAATLDLGASTTTVRQVSTYAESEPGYVRRLLSTASLLYWSGYLVLVILVYAAAPYLAAEWIRPQQMDIPTVIAALRIFGIGALTVLPRSLYASLLRGLQRMQFNNAIDAALAGLQLLGTLVILSLHGNLVDVGYWFAACYTLGIASYLLVASRFVGWSGLMPRFSTDVVRRNASFASTMLLISLVSTVHAQTDRLFVSKLLPLQSFGFYSVAARVVSAAMLPAAAVVQAALPSFSAALGAADHAGALAQYRRLQSLVCFGMVPVLAGVAFATSPVFSFILEPAASATLFLPTVLLCVAYYLNVTMQIPYIYSLAADKPAIAARWNVSALVLLPIVGVLVNAFGLVGAAVSTIVYQLWAYAYMVRRICVECLGVSPWSWYREIVRIGLMSFLTYGVALAAARALDASDLLIAAGAYAAATAAFAGASYRFAGVGFRDLWRQARHTMPGAASHSL